MDKITRVAVVDDHNLIQNGMSQIIATIPGFKVTIAALNGKDFLNQLSYLAGAAIPEITFVDINMPEMNGYETTRILKEKYPQIKVIALSMFDNEHTTLQMLRCGAKGFVGKHADPIELEKALYQVNMGEYYYPEIDTARLHLKNSSNGVVSLTEKQIEFLQYCCEELSYVEIASLMCRSIHTIYAYRDLLYEKLEVKSRTGLIVYALQSGLALLK